MPFLMRPWLSEKTYSEMAVEARRRGFPDLDRYFQGRARDAALYAEQEQDAATAREVIEQARLAAALEFEAMGDIERAMERRA